MEEEKAVPHEAKDEPKEGRFARRLKARKREILDTYINLFFTERSMLKDPEGEEADKIYVKYRNAWLKECTSFNKNPHRPFTLRASAFADNVERIFNMEQTGKKKKEEENKLIDFRHWFRKNAGWKKMFWRTLWFTVKGWYKKTDTEHLWKNYYVKNILTK